MVSSFDEKQTIHEMMTAACEERKHCITIALSTQRFLTIKIYICI